MPDEPVTFSPHEKELARRLLGDDKADPNDLGVAQSVLMLLDRIEALEKKFRNNWRRR